MTTAATTNGKSKKTSEAPIPFAPPPPLPPPSVIDPVDLLGPVVLEISRGRKAAAASLIDPANRSIEEGGPVADAVFLTLLLIRSRGGLDGDLREKLGDLLSRVDGAARELAPATVVATLQQMLTAEENANRAESLRRLGVGLVNLGGLQGPTSAELVASSAARVESLSIEALAPFDRLAFAPHPSTGLARLAIEEPGRWPLIRLRKLRPGWIAAAQASPLALEQRSRLEAISPLSPPRIVTRPVLMAIGAIASLILAFAIGYGSRWPRTVIVQTKAEPVAAPPVAAPEPAIRPLATPDLSALWSHVPGGKPLLMIATPGERMTPRSALEFRSWLLKQMSPATPVATNGEATAKAESAAVAKSVLPAVALLDYGDFPVASKVPASVFASPSSGRLLQQVLGLPEMKNIGGLLIVRRISDAPDRPTDSRVVRLAFELTTAADVVGAPVGVVPGLASTVGEIELPDALLDVHLDASILERATRLPIDATSALVADALMASSPDDPRSGVRAAAVYLLIPDAPAPAAKDAPKPASLKPAHQTRAAEILSDQYRRGVLDHPGADAGLKLLVVLSGSSARDAFFATHPALRKDAPLQAFLTLEAQPSAPERDAKLNQMLGDMARAIVNAGDGR